MIFDAHMHIPCFDENADFHSKKLRLLHDMEISGITGGIIIADSLMESPIGNNVECLKLFEDCKNIFIMAGISPLINYEEQFEFIKGNIGNKKLIGVKIFPGHEHYFLNDKKLERTFELCESHNVPLAVHTGWDNNKYNDPKFFIEISENHPKLKIVICHMWYPHIDYCVKITEEKETIFYDISSLAYEQNKQEKIRGELSIITKRHSERIIFGSDYGGCTMQSHIDLVNSLEIKEEIKEAIMWKNAKKVYKIKL